MSIDLKPIVRDIVDNAMTDDPGAVVRGVNVAMQGLAQQRLAEIRKEISSEMFEGGTE
jgi:hypothetical protein